MDYASFKNCLEVSKSWNDLLTSESFLKKAKALFSDKIQMEVLQAADEGNVDIIQKVLSTFNFDINLMTGKYNSSPPTLVVLIISTPKYANISTLLVNLTRQISTFPLIF